MSDQTAVVEQEETKSYSNSAPCKECPEEAVACEDCPELNTAANGQAQLIPDETKEEEDVREVLIPMQPHEVLEAVDRIVTLNQEVNEQEQELEREKSRHKEAKDKITANIDAARPKLSKLIEQTGLKKKKETRNTRKVINFTTKQVQWFLRETGELVDERPMVAAEYQVKLALTPPADKAEEGAETDDRSEDGAELGSAAEVASEHDVDVQGVDPATMDDEAQGA